MLVGGWSQKETAPANNRYDNVVGVAAAALLSFLALFLSFSLSPLFQFVHLSSKKLCGKKNRNIAFCVFFVVVMFFV